MAEEVILRISAEDNTAPGINSAVARFTQAAQALSRSTGGGPLVNYTRLENEARTRNRQRDAADDADFKRKLANNQRMNKEQAEKDSKERQESYKRHQDTVLQAKGVTDQFGNATGVATRGVGSMRSQVVGMAAEFVTAATAVEFARRSMLAWGQADQQIRRMQVQTGRPRADIEKLMPQLRDLAMATANELDDVVAGFSKVREESGLSLEQVKQFFPIIATAAKGAGVSVFEMSDAFTSFMLNFKVGGENAAQVMDMMVKSGTKLGLNLQEIVAGAPRLSAAMKSWGYEGAEGVKEMLGFLVAIKPEFNSTGQAVQQLTMLFNDMTNPRLAARLGMNEESLTNYLTAAKEAGQSTLGVLTGLAKYAVEQRGGNLELMFGKLQAPIMRALISNLEKMPEHFRNVADAAGMAAAAGEIMGKGMDASLTNAVTAIKELAGEVGGLITMFGGGTALTNFTGLLRDISKAMRWVSESAAELQKSEGLNWLLKDREIPTMWKFYGDLFNRMSSDGGKAKMPGLSDGPQGDDSVRGSAGDDTLDDRDVLQEERAQRSALVNIERYLHDIHAHQGLSSGAGGSGGGGLGGAPMGRAAGAAAGGAAAATGESAAAAADPSFASRQARGSGKGSAQQALMRVAMDQLRKEGVPEGNLRAAAAHLVGQTEMESGFNPNAVHDNKTGFGLYGARDPTPGRGRKTSMLNWMQARGYAPNSAEGQMRYMAHEAMSGRYPQTRRTLMNADPSRFETDTNVVTKEFEGPKYVNRRAGAVGGAFRAGPEEATAAMPRSITRQTERAAEEGPGPQSSLDQIRAARAELEAPITIRTRMDAVEPSFRRASMRYDIQRETREGRQQSFYDTGAA